MNVLFFTSKSVETVRHCQEDVGFCLPSLLWAKCFFVSDVIVSICFDFDYLLLAAMFILGE